MSEADRERELSRLFYEYAAMPLNGDVWNRLYGNPSKSRVDDLVSDFNRAVKDIRPRTYDVFSDVEIRDGICRKLGTA
jgi:hypothetical protein